MNILFVSFLKKGGGAESAINNLLELVNEKNNSLKLRAIYKSDFTSSTCNILNTIRFLKKIRDLSENVEVAISSVEGSPYIFLYLALLGVKKPPKTILWLHCEPKTYLKFQSLKNIFFIKLSCFLANNIICASPIAAKGFQKTNKNTIFLPNFIENKVILASEFSNQNIPISYDLIFIGSLAKLKQPDVALKTFVSLKNDNKCIRKLHIYGSGVMNDSLEGMAESLGASQDILMHGYVNSPLSSPFVNPILMVTSLTEAMPMVIVEALVRGIPVMCNKYIGSEFFNIKNGMFFLVDFENLKSVNNVFGIITKLSDSDVSLRRSRSISFVKKNFNNKHTVSLFENYVSNL